SKRFANRLDCGVAPVGFYAEENQVVGCRSAGIFSRNHPDREITSNALDLESMLDHCAEMIATPTEDDVLAGSRQPRPQVATNRTRAHHENFHRIEPLETEGDCIMPRWVLSRATRESDIRNEPDVDRRERDWA